MRDIVLNPEYRLPGKSVPIAAATIRVNLGVAFHADVASAGTTVTRMCMAFPLPNPMKQALAAARAAADAGEVPIGAVLTRDGKVVATAGNETRAGCDPTAHAEILVIRRAAETLGKERLDGCDLWVTLEPCAMCAGAIAHARISRLYYAAPDPKGGGVEHGARVFDQPTCHHRPEIYSGLGEAEAAAMLRGFFVTRR